MYCKLVTNIVIEPAIEYLKAAGPPMKSTGLELGGQVTKFED